MSKEELKILRKRLTQAANYSSEFTVAGARASWYAFTDDYCVPEGFEVKRDEAAGCAIEWIRRPEAPSDTVLLYLHGGGYVCGALTTHRPLTCELAKTFPGSVVALDYRLAPEHPFPAAIEDSAATYRWLVAGGLSPSRIAIAGESAGGGLAIATLLTLHGSGTPLPAAAYCISPWTDLSNSGESVLSKHEVDPIVFPQVLDISSRLYLAGASATNPLASPALADLRGLPPLLIQVGSHETLLDDAVRLARAAGAADVEVQLEVWPEMLHAWQLFSPTLEEGRASCARATRWVSAHFGSP